MSLENMTPEEVEFWRKGFEEAFEAIAEYGLWRCPECQGLMPWEAKDYNSCATCGVEFGYDAPEYKNTEQLWGPK